MSRSKAGDVPRTPEQTKGDFRTDIDPTLFRDNWGVDVVAEHGAKVKAPIDAAVQLAQLMASVRTGEAADPDALDTEELRKVSFFDGSNGEQDHFFHIELDPRYEGSSYGGPRVDLTFMTGSVNLDAYAEGEPVHATYDERWSTRRADIIKWRDESLFEQDLARINNAFRALLGASAVDLSAGRPDVWPGEPNDEQAYLDGVHGLRIAGQAVYIGDTPLEGVGPESARQVRIPFLDDDGDIGSMPNPKNIGETLGLFAAIDSRNR